MQKLVFGCKVLDWRDGGRDSSVVAICGANGEGICASWRSQLKSGYAIVANNAFEALASSLGDNHSFAGKSVCPD